MMQLAVNWRYGTIGPVWFRRLLWAWRWYWSGERMPLSEAEIDYLCRKLDESERCSGGDGKVES